MKTLDIRAAIEWDFFPAYEKPIIEIDIYPPSEEPSFRPYKNTKKYLETL